MKARALLVSLALFSVASAAWPQVNTFYQPTPYPNTLSESIHHVVDGWINDSTNTILVRDSKLQVGGVGDTYRTYIRFNLVGLPTTVTKALLWFKTFPASDGSSPTSFAICKVTSPWSASMSWSQQPTSACSPWYSPGTVGLWWGLDVTSWYNEWQQNPSSNHGVMLKPRYNDNRFDLFRSSRSSTLVEHPYLALTFSQPVATPNLKLPLPGGLYWRVTTEAGGWDCTGRYDQFHDGLNFFSIDFSWRNVTSDGQSVYAESDDIPVLAAADGIVELVGNDINHPNGYYVVLRHGNFTTRYLHFRYPPSVVAGQSLQQGDQLGIMGNTGVSFGTHVHFGVRYNNSGAATIDPLRYLMLDSRLLRSYETKCSGNSQSGGTTLYYLSTNQSF